MKFDADWWKRAAEHLSNEKVELQAELAAVREERVGLRKELELIAAAIGAGLSGPGPDGEVFIASNHAYHAVADIKQQRDDADAALAGLRGEIVEQVREHARTMFGKYTYQAATVASDELNALADRLAAAAPGHVCMVKLPDQNEADFPPPEFCEPGEGK